MPRARHATYLSGLTNTQPSSSISLFLVQSRYLSAKSSPNPIAKALTGTPSLSPTDLAASLPPLAAVAREQREGVFPG